MKEIVKEFVADNLVFFAIMAAVVLMIAGASAVFPGTQADWVDGTMSDGL